MRRRSLPYLAFNPKTPAVLAAQAHYRTRWQPRALRRVALAAMVMLCAGQGLAQESDEDRIFPRDGYIRLVNGRLTLVQQPTTPTVPVQPEQPEQRGVLDPIQSGTAARVDERAHH